MSDLIKREDAIKVLHDEWDECLVVDESGQYIADICEEVIKAVPSADRPQDDEFKTFDRESLILLIEAQKERIGELMADRPQGEWIMHFDDIWPEESTQECSVCHEYQIINGNDDNYCPNCGARMKGADDELVE